MSMIKLRAKSYPDFGDIAPDYYDPEMEPIRQWAGQFNTETAIYWESQGADTDRVWLTPSGRWVLTTRSWDSYITVDEARAWLGANGHGDAIREHIDVERDGRGRPEIGPEVKFRIPEHVRDSIDALAAANGVTRADQLRAIVMDTVLPIG